MEITQTVADLKAELTQTVADLKVVTQTVGDLKAEIGQLESIIAFEGGRPLSPPKHLQVRVIGGFFADFISSGYSTYDQLNRFLSNRNRQLSDFHDILDFGCGCGRIVRALRQRLPADVRLFGTDIDSEAIAWLQENYRGIAEFGVNPHLPPTAYRDNTFDFIYSVSILTHLPEAMQFAWLKELHRIAKPGALLILTTSGDHHRRTLSPAELAQLDATGFFYRETTVSVAEGLPAFYSTAHHSPSYIQREWKQWFDILEFQANGLDNWQDMTLLAKRLS